MEVSTALPMPKLGDITHSENTRLPLSKIPWLEDGVGIVAGGIYLLAGDPGVGKTTIAIEVALALAAQRNKILYLTNEQSPSDLKATTDRIKSGMKLTPSESAVADDYFHVVPIARLEDLDIYRDHAFLPDGEYSDLKCLVIDSVQGGGLSPTARRGYNVLERFVMAAKAHKVSSILIAHVTKAGAIAGPKDLEHQVDVVLQFKKAFKLRPLFVPKNRYGAARLDPIPLLMGEGGLFTPPHMKPTGTTIQAVDFSEMMKVGVQARVQLPKWGERPGLKAPYLPKEKLRLLLDGISALPDVDASELTYQIACYVPGDNSYSSGLDLAVVMAILSSYLQRDVPDGMAFYGEVDLHGNVLSPLDGAEATVYKNWSKPSKPDEDEDDDGVSALDTFLDRIKTVHEVVVPKDAEKGLKHWKGVPELKSVGNILDAVGVSWPDLV